MLKPDVEKVLKRSYLVVEIKYTMKLCKMPLRREHRSVTKEELLITEENLQRCYIRQKKKS